MSYDNGTVYSKYKKVKDSGGVSTVDKYITDEKKTLSDGLNQNPSGSEDLPAFEESDVQKAMSYIENDVKTINPANYQNLVSGVNCAPAVAVEMFRMDEEDYHKVKTERLLPGQKPNKAFHIILSYKGRDAVSPELCHKLGVEFAKRIAGDDFRAVVATHLNTDNVHNHVLLCAYSMDRMHPHKYLDKLNQYKYFRKVANELSVEYGLPIFLSDESTKSISWAEMVKTEAGQSWVGQLKSDISSVMDISDDFDAVLDGMRTLEYGVTVNKNSVTYSRGAYRARDRRLGHQYTREGFTERKAKLDATKESAKATGRSALPAQKPMDFTPIFISRYDEEGHRRGTLIRLLLMIRELIKRFGDSFFMAMEEPDTLRPELSPANEKLKLIDSTIAVLNKFHISSMENLELTLRSLHQGRRETRNQQSSLSDLIDNGEVLRANVDRFLSLYSKVVALGIDPSDLLPDYDEHRINENKASLDPMQPATKSKLYRTLHDSDYSITRPFRELSEAEAREIITVVKNQQLENLPYTVRKRGNGRQKEKDKKLRKRKGYDLSKFSEGEKNEICDFRELLNKFALYGITDINSAENFKTEYDVATQDIKAIDSKLSLITKSIRELYRVKTLCDTVCSSDFAYGVMFTGDSTDLIKSVDQIMAESDKSDCLRVIKNRIDNLDESSETDDFLPDPSKYRLLRDLECVYPGILEGVRMDSPRDVDDAILTLQMSGWLDDEMNRMEKNEKATDRPKIRDMKKHSDRG